MALIRLVDIPSGNVSLACQVLLPVCSAAHKIYCGNSAARQYKDGNPLYSIGCEQEWKYLFQKKLDKWAMVVYSPSHQHHQPLLKHFPFVLCLHILHQRPHLLVDQAHSILLHQQLWPTILEEVDHGLCQGMTPSLVARPGRNPRMKTWKKCEKTD